MHVVNADRSVMLCVRGRGHRRRRTFSTLTGHSAQAIRHRGRVIAALSEGTGASPESPCDRQSSESPPSSSRCSCVGTARRRRVRCSVCHRLECAAGLPPDAIECRGARNRSQSVVRCAMRAPSARHSSGRFARLHSQQDARCARACVCATSYVNVDGGDEFKKHAQE